MRLNSSPGFTAALARALVVTFIVLLFSGASALAAGPATVTVRVEGSTQTLIGPTQVTTTAAPVVNDGNPADACPGYSDLGALQLATAGNWSGHWFMGSVNEHGKFEGLGYSVETIAGESHAFAGGSFWDIWLDHKESPEGLCEAEGENGAEVLLFPCAAEACPTPLGIEAPATAQVGQQVPVRVIAYSTSGSAAPVEGASLSGATSTATTGPDGRALVTFGAAGSPTLSASAEGHVRDEASVCVHTGDDGTCGTATPGTGGTVGVVVEGFKANGPGSPYKGPYALVADVSSVKNGHRYTRADAPRLLAGTIRSHTAVSAVRLKLRRSYRGRCSSYDATRGRFVRARCGGGSFFAASSTAAFSYLLPKRLGPGRYVLDVQATDVAGNSTTLARGSSRVVFDVR